AASTAAATIRVPSESPLFMRAESTTSCVRRDRTAHSLRLFGSFRPQHGEIYLPLGTNEIGTVASTQPPCGAGKCPEGWNMRATHCATLGVPMSLLVTPAEQT